MQAPKLVITGRDGILNIFRSDHVKAPEEWQPIPGALEAVARLNHAGWHVVVATNQSGIGRGMIDMTSVNAVHSHMMRLLSEKGGRIDAVFFCPHAATEQCECRKPAPGLMHDIGERYGVELSAVPMVCDTLRDLEAAQGRRLPAAPGAHRPRRGGRRRRPSSSGCRPCRAPRCTTDMAAFAEHLIGN